jgi:nitrite reductase (NADH) small subunit
MTRWIAVARTEDCPPGSVSEFVVEDRIVALVCDSGEFLALDGVCPHQGGPLGQGELAGGVVTCPWHGWQFDVRTGCNLASPNIIQPRLAVRVEGETIYVDLDAS